MDSVSVCFLLKCWSQSSQGLAQGAHSRPRDAGSAEAWLHLHLCAGGALVTALLDIRDDAAYV